MSSWSYCARCNKGLDKPSVIEVVEQSQQCPACYFSNDPHMTVGELLIDLTERVEKLEDMLAARREEG